MDQHVTVTKPSRSDEVLDVHQQLQITNKVKALFDSQAPKRLAKPNRSEPDSSSVIIDTTTTTLQDFNIPELDNLISLQSQGGSMFFGSNRSLDEQEEYVETGYYDKLVSIDKQHHTTGSGFIIVGNQMDGSIYNLELNGGHENDRAKLEFKTNPATNDWIPSSDHQVGFISSKPKRSESD